MAAHSDEQLLEVYKNRGDYTEEACQAIVQVLGERNLMSEAAIIDDELEKFVQNQKKVETETYEEKRFGEVVSDEEFAKNNLVNGIYIEKKLSPMYGFSRFAFLFIMIGACGLTFALVMMNIGHRPKDMDLFYYISWVISLLLPYGIWIIRKSKATLKVTQLGRKSELEIKDGFKNITILLPINYTCYYRWDRIKYNIKQVRLFIYIDDPLKNETIIITEQLPALKQPPLGWKLIEKDHEEPKNKILSYQNYGFQKPFLEEFVKIIRGLS